MRAGWALDRDELYAQAGVGPADMDFVETYDDYPVISLMQLEDLGFCAKGEGAGVRAQAHLHPRRHLPAQHQRRPALGRAGGRGRRLPRHGRGDPPAHRRGRRARQVKDAKLGLVSGFGMINFDRGLGSGAASSCWNDPNVRIQCCARACRRCRRRRAAASRSASPPRRRWAASSCSSAATAARCSTRREKPARSAFRQTASGRSRPTAASCSRDTVLHHSNDLFFRERLPWRLGS